jgi:hypothetical protein
MRTFILIAALVLVSASAQAGVSRGLTLASNDEPAAAEQPKTVEAPKAVDAAKPADAPKFVDRPVAVNPTADAPKGGDGKSVADKNAQPLKAEKPKHRRESTEARVIYELHRHGIYW